MTRTSQWSDPEDASIAAQFPDEVEMRFREDFMKHGSAVASAAAVIAIIGVTGCFSQQKTSSGPTQPSAANSSHAASAGARKVDIADPAYGMTAYTANVPASYKFVGAILRPGGCHPPPTPAAGLSYTTLGPDGLTAYMSLPGVSWTWTSNGSNMMGQKCPSNIDIDTAAGLLVNIAVPNLHPNATAVTVVPLPQNIQDTIAANNRKGGGYGPQGPRQFQDAAQVHVEYDLNGHAVEESLFAMIDCTESKAIPMPGGIGQPVHPGYTRRNCSSRGTMITRAPKGHLQEVLKNGPGFPQVNPAWDQRVIHDMTANFQQMQAASNAQFAAIQEHFKQQTAQMNRNAENFRAQQKSSFDSAMQNDRNTQAAIDHSAHQTALYSLDRQTFINPATGQKIEASNQYNHQWVSSDGSTLIQTQNHTYDPNGVVYPVQQSWTELVPTN